MTPTATTAARKLAVDTDTALAELDGQYARLEAQRDKLISAVRSTLKERPVYRGRRAVFTRPADESVAALLAKLAGDELPAWQARDSREVLAHLSAVEQQMRDNRAAADELDAVWAANGHWSRFFLVPGGHIHRDISHSRCSRQPTTTHAWAPQLSGGTEEETVAEHGPLLCTVCFPSAPVEWTVGHPKPARCAGSGKAPAEGTRKKTGMRAYGDCPECGYRGQLNPSTWAVRAHKPPQQ